MAVPVPYCKFCDQNHGAAVPATIVAAQSTDQGKTVDWAFVCSAHADGWNDGADWRAPLYALLHLEQLKSNQKMLQMLAEIEQEAEVLRTRANALVERAYSFVNALPNP